MSAIMKQSKNGPRVNPEFLGRDVTPMLPSFALTVCMCTTTFMPWLEPLYISVQYKQYNVVLIYFEKPEKKPEARG